MFPNVWIWAWTVGLYWTLGTGLMQAYRIPWPNWSVLLQVWVNQFCVEYLVIYLLPAFPVRAVTLRDGLDLFITLGWTEFSFYWIHRLLHHRMVFRWIHAQHHTWKIPIPLIAAYAHPLEHLFLNMGATLSAPVGLQMNAWVVWVWMSLCVSTTLMAHLPYNKDIHYQHHRSPRSNYSVFGWMDWIHTTRNKNV